MKSKAKHAAISSRLNKPFVFSSKPFVVQYEVTLQEGQECGGSYIKLLSSGKETTDLGHVCILSSKTLEVHVYHLVFISRSKLLVP